MILKNLFVYYLVILIPLLGIIQLKHLELISPTFFMVLFLGYFVIFRTWTDGLRLHKKDLISKDQIWKLALPGRRVKYLKELYFK